MLTCVVRMREMIGVLGAAVAAPGIDVGISEMSLLGTLVGRALFGFKVITKEGDNENVGEGGADAEKAVGRNVGEDAGVSVVAKEGAEVALAVVVTLTDGTLVGFNVKVSITLGINVGDSLGRVEG